MFRAHDVSIVIPSFNSRHTIRACLDALLAQTQPACEIIIFDSSDDGTEAIIASEYPQVRLKHKPYRIFPGPARNRGALMASGAILAFIDADCLAAPDWVARIVENHNHGHLVVGGAIDVGNDSSSIAWAGHLGEFRQFIPAGEPRHMLHIPTCNISYRKALFDLRGGFPDSYYPQEDLLFNYLLNLQGIHIWFDPNQRVRHYYREGLGEFLSHQHRIGRVTRSTLRRIEMPGAWIARRTWLAWLSAPLLGLLKLTRNLAVVLSHFRPQLTRHPALPLYLLLGAIWWARGFAASAAKGLSGIRGWDDPEEAIFSALTAVEPGQRGK